MMNKPSFNTKKKHSSGAASGSAPTRQPKTSWEKVGNWYNGIVGNEGHYYHQTLVLPGVLRLLNLNAKSNGSLLDIACGQGVLARQLPAGINYSGVDLSSTLIKNAKQASTNKAHEFVVADVSKPLPLAKKDFSYATILLALQNIEDGAKVIENAMRHLQPQGKLLIVLNHPCFRIPRQSSWEIDEEKKIQFRRIDRYSSPLKIPIQMHPGKGENSPSTFSFHHSLATYSDWLFKAGFQITKIEEWSSDKVSTGKNAKMENRSREEIPLFMAILATKN
jgi:ubiquinone/menaquinone biosynthesis C-methylase UbiE